MRGRNVAAWTAGIAVLGVALAAVAFHAFLDSESLASHARERAREAWGRELAVGAISLEILPRPALRVREVALSNPQWAKERHFLVAESVAANFEVLPLLLGRVRVKSLFIRGARMNIEAGPEGTTFPRREEKRPATAEAMPFPSLDAIRIRNSVVHNRTPDGKEVEWGIEAADITSDGGMRDIDLEARVHRNRQAFQLRGRLEDASRFGHEGATTQGRLELKSEAIEAGLEGRIPLHRSLRGHDVKADIKARHLNEVFAFFGRERQPTAAFAATLAARDDNGVVHVHALQASLGQLRIGGEARITPGERVRIEARLASDRLDWAQAFLDSGGRRVTSPRTDKLYSDRPMAWRLLEALKEKEGTVDLALKSARLRNGIELGDAKLRLAFDGPNLEVKPFSARMLGGTATGSLAFGAAKRTVRIHFEGQGLLLERWLKERGSKIPFSGGPMAVSASIAGAGESMQDVAASISGPIAIRIGRGTWHSQRAGEVETLMTNVFAPKDAKTMEFECVGANLPFKAGRATADRMIGARSVASRLVSRGTIDLREGRVDLRGKVEAQKGVTIGVSAIANDIVIAGPLRKPSVSLDSGGAPAAIARVGAAIATAGASLLGTAIAEAATSKNDPCEAVFRK